MRKCDLDHDVSVPEDVAKVLRAAAEAYYESASELAAAWGERSPRRDWTQLAHILERAATLCERVERC